MLLPLSHWAHGRGATHKLHVAALCGGLSQIPTDYFSFNQWLDRMGGFANQITQLWPEVLMQSPADGVVGLGGLTVQVHCLSRYSHYPPPRPPQPQPPATASSHNLQPQPPPASIASASSHSFQPPQPPTSTASASSHSLLQPPQPPASHYPPPQPPLLTITKRVFSVIIIQLHYHSHITSNC